MQMQQKLGWGVSHQELYIRALCGLKDSNERNRDYVIKNHGLNISMSSIPTGYCVRFHTGSSCLLPCKYSLVCYICNRIHPASIYRYAGTTGTNLQFQTPQSKFYDPQEGSNFRPQRVSYFRLRASVPRPTLRGFPRNHISPNRFRTPNSYTPRNLT
jgi:hypothetical protein